MLLLRPLSFFRLFSDTATEMNVSSDVSDSGLYTAYNGHDYSCMFTPAFKSFTIVTASVVFILTTFGNTLILASLFKYRKVFKGSIYIFIGNLALTDMLLAVVMLIKLLEYIVPDFSHSWTFCMTKALGIVVTFVCSMLTLSLIAVDRFMAVVFPLHHIVRSKRSRFFFGAATLCWLSSLLCTIIPILLVRRPTGRVICRLGAMFPSQIHLSAVSLVFANMLVSGILYGILLWKIKAATVGESSNPRRKFTRKTFIMIIVFFLFVCCWIPFIICSFMIETVMSNAEASKYECVREYLTRLGFLNSSMNWIVYGVSNEKFRWAFKKLLCCKQDGQLSRFMHTDSGSSSSLQYPTQRTSASRAVSTVETSNHQFCCLVKKSHV